MKHDPIYPTPLITADELRQQLTHYRVIDCSHDLEKPDAGFAAYVEGHVPGALHAHLDRHLSGPKTGTNGRHPLPPAESLAYWLGEQGIAADDCVVAYDRSGGAYAARLWWLLRWLGHRHVRVLDGGWQAWLAIGGAVSVEASCLPPVAYHAARPDSSMCVDAAFVLRNLDSADALIVDARGRQRYEGVTEPIDARAGHIPGAVNRPYTDNLAADGCFKSAGELASEWRRVLHDRDAADVVAQCGSGVTACHNLLAMAVAGLAPARLYPGSWSEWSSDPSRPVALGAESA